MEAERKIAAAGFLELSMRSNLLPTEAQEGGENPPGFRGAPNT